jgi:probable phosphoglycerate mutase
VSELGNFSEVVLIRHGSTSWSESGRHTGRTDIYLDERGRIEAEGLAARVPKRIELVCSSPLRRALDTARLSGLSSAPVVLEDLVEWDYGEYEGLTTAEIRRVRPGWDLFRDGCPGGEDAASVGRRVDRVLDALGLMPDADRVVALVAHGHLLRVLCARFLGLAPGAGALFALDAGSVGSLGFEREQRVLKRWNS